jgi:DNA polymerase III subunit delta'
VSADEAEIDQAAPPRVTAKFFGHGGIEAALLGAYRSGRVPHAFMLIGQNGIGKATLAYRMARFVLAHPDPSAPSVQAATSLAVDPEHPAARRVAAQAHGDLLVLERMPNDKGVLRQQIAVDDVRRTISFFGATAGEGGWRVAIVDAVDELNRAGANALLKVLEEPPQRALLLLVCHSASRVLPTLRSRCCVLPMRPLPQGDVARALAASVGATEKDPQIEAAAAAADGSVARALAFLDEDALALRQRALEELERLPALNAGALHALGDALAGTDPRPLNAFIDTVNAWLSGSLGRHGGSGGDDLVRTARLAEAWGRINSAARDAETYNLERKPLVFSVFGLLAEATSG